MVELPANLEVFTIADVARIFRVSVKTVFAWKKPVAPGESRRVLEFAKAGGLNITTRRNIQAFLCQPEELQPQPIPTDYEQAKKLFDKF